MRFRPLLVRVAAVVLASLVVAAPAAAQKTATGGELPCAKVLSADEIRAAVGVALERLEPVDRGRGETECGWMARGGPGGLKTVAVIFYDQSAITQSASATGDAFFEMLVTGTEESLKVKREVIPGTGKHAAFVPADPQTLAVVHRADGVARIVANGLTKTQTIAVAKAVATP
jgi:hypothetical protein